jgi:hypothetical protein
MFFHDGRAARNAEAPSGLRYFPEPRREACQINYARSTLNASTVPPSYKYRRSNTGMPFPSASGSATNSESSLSQRTNGPRGTA